MTEPDMTEPNLKRSHANPSDDYPPTRPSKLVIFVALGLLVAGLGLENWSDISALANLPRIERALGL